LLGFNRWVDNHSQPSILLPLNHGSIGIGQTIQTGNNRVNFGFGGSNGLPLGIEALLDEGFYFGFIGSNFLT
jgi:hypothetical protein